MLALVRNISGAFGIAIFTTNFKNATESALIAVAQNSVISTDDPAVLREAAALMVLKAQVAGYHTVFIVAALVMLVSAALALIMIKVREKKSGVEVFTD